MDILSKFPMRLKELMDEAEVKTPELAEKTKIDQSAIARFLKGERLPSAESLTILADFFRCSTDYLLGRSDVLDDRVYKRRPPFSEQINILLKHFKITKYRLGKDVKLSDETINRWQKGLYEPTVESLVRIAKEYDCSVDFILGRT